MYIIEKICFAAFVIPQIADGGYGYPVATNMQKLSWNNDLAILIQNWLNQCPEDNAYEGMHDEYRNRNFPKLTVGQNLSVKSFKGKLI